MTCSPATAAHLEKEAAGPGRRQPCTPRSTASWSCTECSVATPCFQYGQTTNFGLLKLTLHSDSYNYRFISISGKALGQGAGIRAN